MKRILLVSPFSPVASHDHAASDTFNALARRLARNYELHVFAPSADENDFALAQNNGFVLWSGRRAPTGVGHKVRAAFGPRPMWLREVWTADDTAAVRRVHDRIRPALTHCEYLQTGEVLPAVGGAGVLVLHDVTTDVMRSAMRTASGPLRTAHRVLEYVKTKQCESLAIRNAPVLASISLTDLQTLRQSRGDATYIPIGVEARAVERPRGQVRQGTILFSGALWRLANEAAAMFMIREVMPLVWREFPNADLRIVGSRPSERLQRSALDPRVEVVGFVDSLDDEYLRADVVAAPSVVGGGVLMKVLRPMSVGAPVVTTRHAAQAIGAVGIVSTADSAVEFASELGVVLRDAQRSHDIGEAGRAHIVENFSWQRVDQCISDAYTAAAAGQQYSRR